MARAPSIALFCVAFALASPARADETIEISPYASWRRPLTPSASPGPPSLGRSIAGGAIDWTDAPAPNRSGWVLRFGGAVEHQADCSPSASCAWPAGGDSHVEWGAHARFGWFWRSVQLEGGLMVFTASLEGTPPPPRELTILPDAVARVGTRTMFFAVGFGTFTGASILSPSTYLQGELPYAERWATTLTIAAHNGPFAARDVDAYRYLRFDVATRYRVNRAIRTGVGLGLTTNDSHTPRTRFGGEVRFIFEWVRNE